MDHYLDIRLLPDPEIPAAALMSELVGRLHRALAGPGGAGTSHVGTSFPQAQAHSLGGTMRLHGTPEALTPLHAMPWLRGLSEHVSVGDIRQIPITARHRTVRRVQAKSNPARLRRRLMQRHGFDEAEALRRIPDTLAQHVDLPFVQLRSTSTGQSFRLFIEHGPIVDAPRTGDFSTYGLSDHATVPWF